MGSETLVEPSVFVPRFLAEEALAPGDDVCKDETLEEPNHAEVLEVTMRYEAFYVIRPAESLKRRLRELGLPREGEPFAPLLWINKQGGRGCWTAEDHQVAIKCLYVAYVRYCILPRGDFRVIFDDLEVSVVGFDAWWEMEVFDGYDDTVEEVVQEVLERSQGLMDKGVTGWVDSSTPLGRLLFKARDSSRE